MLGPQVSPSINAGRLAPVSGVKAAGPHVAVSMTLVSKKIGLFVFVVKSCLLLDFYSNLPLETFLAGPYFKHQLGYAPQGYFLCFHPIGSYDISGK
jgi:hypothetical protein